MNASTAGWELLNQPRCRKEPTLTAVSATPARVAVTETVPTALESGPKPGPDRRQLRMVSSAVGAASALGTVR